MPGARGARLTVDVSVPRGDRGDGNVNVVDELAILVRLGRWGLAMARHDTHSASPVPDNPKFVSPRQAAALIRDGAVMAASGLGAHQRASILYWALREAFAETGHPRNLTVVNVGGHGSRGLLPGTLDELAQPGLCTRFITSHFETFRAVLELAASGRGCSTRRAEGRARC
jgi:propionate CoA-transferase